MNRHLRVGGLAVKMATLEVQPNVGFIPDNPCVVSGWEKLGVTWPYFALCTIVHPHVQAARNAVVEMWYLATLRTGCGFHVL